MLRSLKRLPEDDDRRLDPSPRVVTIAHGVSGRARAGAPVPARRRLPVLLTVDTEFWPRPSDGWRTVGRRDIRRDIFGDTPAGEYGIRYQMETFARHDLRAVYFVEALSAGIVGVPPLREVVEVIRTAGHDVQLHVHAEWLPWLLDMPYAGSARQHLDEFSQDEQTAIMVRAIEYMRKCGVKDLAAFRAGNFTASPETIAALAGLGIRYDSSLNRRYTRSDFGDATHALQPVTIASVCELPVSWFRDGVGRVRPVQLAGCSAAELLDALLHAWRAKWPAFVIVLHSFDLLNKRRTGPDATMLRRFGHLCRWLDEHRDKFETVTFPDIVADDLLAPAPVPRPLISSMRRTVSRLSEQIRRR